MGVKWETEEGLPGKVGETAVGENTNKQPRVSSVDQRDEKRSLQQSAAPLEDRASPRAFGNTVGTVFGLTSGGGLHLVGRSQGS